MQRALGWKECPQGLADLNLGNRKLNGSVLRSSGPLLSGPDADLRFRNYIYPMLETCCPGEVTAQSSSVQLREGDAIYIDAVVGISIDIGEPKVRRRIRSAAELETTGTEEIIR